jgi:predicted DNA-binding mobile mystery protein A
MKAPKEQKIISKQVSRRLEEARPLLAHARGISSWIDYVRQGLGMSLTQLAARVGVAQSSLSSSIKLEKEGRISIHKLKEIADAMDCDLVYEFVPRKKIEELMRDQAILKTKSLMAEAETHMGLEDQKVTLDKNERLQDLVEERMYSKFLWDK